MPLAFALSRRLIASGLVLGAVLCAIASGGCRKPPASVPSGVKAARYIGLAVPDQAANLRYFEQSLFTLTCVFSFDLNAARVDSFLSAQPLTPPRAEFRRDERAIQSLSAVGSAAPWWDLPRSTNFVCAIRGGQRDVNRKAYIWTATTALVPVDSETIRVFLVYVEEPGARVPSTTQP
jgi:hypothetical protein